MFSGRTAVVRPSAGAYFSRRNISGLSEGTSIKLGTDIHPVSGNCLTGFQGRKSKVHFSGRRRPLHYGRPSIVRPAEAFRSTVWRRG